MATITPQWTTGLVVDNWVGVGYSDQDDLFPTSDFVVACYNPFIIKGSIDLTGKHGAYIHPRVGKMRGSTFAVAPKLRVFRAPDADDTSYDSVPYAELDITTATATEHNVVVDAAAGVTSYPPKNGVESARANR